ncbi:MULTISPECIES: alpha/beta fold hydrolase [unclassified Streptomyces]|uniref:alpha/beta fold hydrolase n=1 Tax=unclassified Streptomyces TaxID=2593676 RepID=UPI000DD551FD|nr:MULTISPECIES: alpha/beta fold hydrolase [unclassified Streptomyces]QZZ25875.1 alpha/beta hydrolase [Streptomyces sp. ST1015]
MNSPARAGTLPAPGATLYYEVRGTEGPPLLLLAGGNSDAAVFTDLADELAKDHLVISCDPRGNSRSTLTGPPVDQRIEEHGEDIARLLDHLVPDERVRLFGSCSGALAALHFASLHPSRVAALIVHEPPSLRLLPDADDFLALVDRVRETLHEEGEAAAMETLSALFGGRPAPDLPEAHDNTRFFLAHMLHPSSTHLPDLAATAPITGRLAIAGGEGSRDQGIHRPALELAAQLGLELAEFPGGHVGYARYPREFANRLRSLMTDLSG